jgi:single-strand DNA-binding protein
MKGEYNMINQVILVGRLTKDPELRYTPEGKAVSNITLAVNRNFKNSDGDYDADFVHCTIWKRTAENLAQYCQKGSLIGISGRIQTRNYSNQEGKKVYVTEVVAEGVKFFSKGTPSSKERELIEI